MQWNIENLTPKEIMYHKQISQTKSNYFYFSNSIFQVTLDHGLMSSNGHFKDEEKQFHISLCTLPLQTALLAGL